MCASEAVVCATPSFRRSQRASKRFVNVVFMSKPIWPLQEILHPIFVDNWYAVTGQTVPDVLLESNGASPSLLNGGLFQPEVQRPAAGTPQKRRPKRRIRRRTHTDV